MPKRPSQRVCPECNIKMTSDENYNNKKGCLIENDTFISQEAHLITCI